jgi:hypothetical protein
MAADIGLGALGQPTAAQERAQTRRQLVSTNVLTR